jgi:hypothetical protein
MISAPAKTLPTWPLCRSGPVDARTGKPIQKSLSNGYLVERERTGSG